MVLFIVLSLLAHAILVVYIIWNPLFDEKKQAKKQTVQIQLKKQAEPESKAAAKTTEAKKAKVAQQEEKKAKVKKAEEKKEKPKKTEPKKTKPKKTKPKKTKPKKTEPKKTEPKKTKPKKTKPKKTKPKKTEPKKTKPKKTEAKKALKKDVKKAPVPKTLDPVPVAEAFKKFGSMRVLEDRELKRAIVFTSSFGERFQNRAQQGKRYIKRLNNYQKQELNEHLLSQLGHLFKTYKGPKKDGGKYFGEISILIDEEGYITNVTFKTRSGHNELDQAVYNSIVEAEKLTMPEDPYVRKAMYLNPLTANYSEEEMVD